MPYDGEYAHYQPLKRIVESERVQQLLRRSRVLDQANLSQQAVPKTPPASDAALPSLVLAIDGSLAEVDRLDASRPVSPIDFRRTEEPSSDASALPGCNVITRDHKSAKDSFREAAFELLHDAIIDEEDNTRLLATYQALLAYKPTNT